MIRLDLARARNKSAGLSLLVQGRQTVTPAGGSGMRCPRAKGSSPLHSGGIGHHVRFHSVRRRPLHSAQGHDKSAEFLKNLLAVVRLGPILSVEGREPD
jgi:hypothetical protein